MTGPETVALASLVGLASGVGGFYLVVRAVAAIVQRYVKERVGRCPLCGRDDGEEDFAAEEETHA